MSGQVNLGMRVWAGGGEWSGGGGVVGVDQKG